jgi:hypothetical protein
MTARRPCAPAEVEVHRHGLNHRLVALESAHGPESASLVPLSVEERVSRADAAGAR